jgi:Xaa-Pro aminopeptidase
MKRGWIYWDKNELPEAEFVQRIERLKCAMRAENLDAVLVYGDAFQSGDLAYLTHFFPYADTGVLIMPINAPPRLVTTHAYRNIPWFNTITWIRDIVCSDVIDRECADYLTAINGPIRKVGLVPAQALPCAVAAAIRERTSCELTDFTAVYESLRIVKSERELGFIEKAAAIATESFEDLAKAIHPGMSGYDVAAELEWAVRRRGAQDLLCFIRPDASPAGLTWPDAKRIQGYFSVEIAVEYNGYWAKLGRSLPLDQSLHAFRPIIERYTRAYRRFLEEEFDVPISILDLERLRSRLLGTMNLRSVRLLAGLGLEPYWSSHIPAAPGQASRLENHATFYLRAALDIDDQMSLLNTDTFLIRDSRSISLAAS